MERDGTMKKKNSIWKTMLLGAMIALLSAGCGGQEKEAESAALTEEAGEPMQAEEEPEEEARMPEETETLETEKKAEENAEPAVEAAPEETDPKENDTTVTMADLMKQSGNGQKQEVSELPDTVLWFNATYAALTYSNGWDWRLVAGLEPTEENIRISKSLLASSWSVTDRESALETVNSLIEKGHRGKCRECMEELKENGLMDVDGQEFVFGLMGTDFPGEPGRYVIAYSMYHEGIDPDYITAWDLCRVNQLYADYYLCGYMEYEEAMDASLKNSLILQKTYDSWDEMMDAYMMGYQFWQGDLAATEGSSTMKRYQNYELLRGMSDSPYALDWDMKLEKSW